MSKNTPHIALVLVVILLGVGLPSLYDWYQQRLRDQNRLREIKGRLAIVQKFGSQNDQMQKTNKKIKNINKDSSKSSIDDQLRKEEKYNEVQKGDNLSKISSTNKIIIKELKVINEINLGESIFSSTNKIIIRELKVINEISSGLFPVRPSETKIGQELRDTPR